MIGCLTETTTCVVAKPLVSKYIFKAIECQSNCLFVYLFTNSSEKAELIIELQYSEKIPPGSDGFRLKKIWFWTTEKLK